MPPAETLVCIAGIGCIFYAFLSQAVGGGMIYSLGSCSGTIKSAV